MKCRGILTVAGCLVAGTVLADKTWPGTAGGDIDVAENWGGTLPSSSEMAFFSTVQTAPLTLHGDSMTFYRLKLDAPGTNVFDLGAGKTALASHRIFFKGGTTLHLKSGTMGCATGGDRIFMGDDQNSGNVSYGSNTLIVDGPNSIFQSAGTSSTGSVNSQFIGLGINNANNTILVCNGGTLNGEMRIGSNQKYSTNNVFRVTGSGSSFTTVGTNRRFETGACGGWNLSEFLDGASMSVDGTVNVGVYQLINNDSKLGYWRGPCNTLRFSGTGTTGTLKGYVQIGLGSSSNLLEVADGASLELRSRICLGLVNSSSYPATLASNCCGNVFYVAPGGTVRQSSAERNFLIGDAEGATGNVLRVCGGYTILDAKRAYNYIGVSGPENMLEVKGGTMIVTNAAAFNVGRAIGAKRCRFDVSEGGLFEHYLTNGTFNVFCGYDAPDNSINVANATFRLLNAPGLDVTSSSIYVGYNVASASNCCLTCTDGGLLEAGKLIVGNMAPNCTLAVTNARINLSGQLNIGWRNSAPAAVNCVASLSGTNATVVAQGKLNLGNNTRIVYSFPANGTISSPVITCSALDTSNGNGLSIAVDVGSEKRMRHRTVELIRTTGTALDSTTLNRISYDLPEGVKIKYTSNAIVADISAQRSLVISFK